MVIHQIDGVKIQYLTQNHKYQTCDDGRRKFTKVFPKSLGNHLNEYQKNVEIVVPHLIAEIFLSGPKWWRPDRTALPFFEPLY